MKSDVNTKTFSTVLPLLKSSTSIPLSNTDSPLNFKTTTRTSTSFALKEGKFGSLQDKAGPQNWYQRILDERTLDATDVKKSSECLKGAFESILFNPLKIFSRQHESKRHAISNVT